LVIAGVVALAAAAVLLAMRAGPDRAARLQDRESSHSNYGATPPSEAPTVHREPPAVSPPRAATPAVIAVEPEPPRLAPVQRAAPRKPAKADEDPLHAELRVIEAARAALERGDHDTALARAGEHRRRFPTGALALEARSLRALALCGAGRWMQGRGEARMLLSDDPTSPYRDRLREACELR
jgi:type IV secretory pathway VirB10-like protein